MSQPNDISDTCGVIDHHDGVQAVQYHRVWIIVLPAHAMTVTPITLLLSAF